MKILINMFIISVAFFFGFVYLQIVENDKNAMNKCQKIHSFNVCQHILR